MIPPTINWSQRVKSLGMTPEEFVRNNAHHMTDSKIAEELRRHGLDATQSKVTHKRKDDIGILKETSGPGKPSWIKVGASPFIKYNTPPEIVGNVCVLNDVELPFHNDEFLNRVLELCQRWGIKKAVANGDFLHHESLSTFDPNWQQSGMETGGIPDKEFQELTDLSVDMPTKHGDRLRELLEKMGTKKVEGKVGISNEWRYARQAAKSLRDVFEEMTLGLGNHEGRLLRAIGSPLLPSEIAKLIQADETWMKVAPYYWGLIESDGVKYRYTHPKNTSVRPASVAADLADKFGTNIIQAHNHLWGMVQSKSGKYVGIEGGCIVDGERLAYYSQRDTTRPQWQNGAVIIRNGKPWLLHSEWTDWEKLKKL